MPTTLATPSNRPPTPCLPTPYNPRALEAAPLGGGSTPNTGYLGNRIGIIIDDHLNSAAEQIDLEARAHSRAHGADWFAEVGSIEEWRRRAATCAVVSSGIARPTPRAGGGVTAAQSSRASTRTPASAPSAARLRRNLAAERFKDCVPRKSHASAMGPAFQRIWEKRYSSLILVGNPYAPPSD